MNKKTIISFDRTFGHISGMCQCAERAGKRAVYFKIIIVQFNRVIIAVSANQLRLGGKVLTAQALPIKLKLKY